MDSRNYASPFFRTFSSSLLVVLVNEVELGRKKLKLSFIMERPITISQKLKSIKDVSLVGYCVEIEVFSELKE